MRTKVHFLKFDEILSTLRTLGFDVQTSPGVANQVTVRKYGAGAVLTRAPEGKEKYPQSAVSWVHKPGFVVGGDLAILLDKGNQKFWKTAKLEVPATADSLKAVHRFGEEVREVIGEPSLYNESLGTTSDSYHYDRVKGRDLPATERPVPAWQLPSAKKQ
jgi:hypothetical protein